MRSGAWGRLHCLFYNGNLAVVLPRPGLHLCEQMAMRNFMCKFAITFYLIQATSVILSPKTG